jgi:hypothetical protein
MNTVDKLKEGFKKLAADSPLVHAKAKANGVFGVPVDGTAGKSPARLRARLQKLKDTRSGDARAAYWDSLLSFGK